MQPERRGGNVYVARKKVPRALLAPAEKACRARHTEDYGRSPLGGDAAPCEMQVIISHARPP